MIFPGCTPDVPGSGNDSIPWEEVPSDEDIVLSGLDDGVLYSVLVEDSSAAARSYGTSLPRTNMNTYLFLPESDGSFSFSPSSLGLQSGDRYYVNRIDGNIYGDMKIEEDKDFFLPYYRDGYLGKLREEFYILDLKELEESGLDLSNVVIIDTLLGSGECSTDYGVIEGPEDIFIRDPKNYAVLDFSDKTFVGLYNSIFIRESRNSYTKELRLVNPVEIPLNDPVVIDDENIVFSVSSKELTPSEKYVIRITPSKGYVRNNFVIVFNNANGRMKETGLRRPYLFPLNYSDDSILLYVGAVDEDFIFDCYLSEDIPDSDNYGTIELISMSELDENDFVAPVRFHITEEILDKAEQNGGVIHEFSIAQGEKKIIPVIFSADDETLLSDFNIWFECADKECNLKKDEIRMNTMSALDKGFGFASDSYYYGKDKVVEILATDRLEYLYFEVYGPQGDHNIQIFIDRK